MDDYFILIKDLILRYAYFAIFLGMIFENTILLGFIIPGILVVLIAGFLAGTGELNLFFCILAAYLGTLVGDNLSYFLGRFGSKRLLFVKKIIDKNKSLQDKILNQNQILLIFFQFPVYLRVFMPITMGFMKYPIKKWLKIDLIGSFFFTTTFICTGYTIAKTTGLFADASTISNWIQVVFFIIFTFWIISLIINLYKTRKRKK